VLDIGFNTNVKKHKYHK